MIKILVTGSTGYIGRHLIPLLIKLGHQVIALVRNPSQNSFPANIAENIKIIQGDLLNPSSLNLIPEDIDAAYYLVHSMATPEGNFVELETASANHFIDFLKKTNVKQIIYLSGLANDDHLSPHLLSRLNVEKILKGSGIPCTILRAGIVIGSGSASYEIIRDLVERLPIMVAPRWIESKCQPIAIEDILYFLTAVLLQDKCKNQTFDVGGPDILTYKEMMLQYAEVRNLKRFIFTVPVLTPRLSSYWLYFVTSTNFALASSLVDSLKNESICMNLELLKLCPRKCISYKDALKQALEI